MAKTQVAFVHSRKRLHLDQNPAEPIISFDKIRAAELLFRSITRCKSECAHFQFIQARFSTYGSSCFSAPRQLFRQLAQLVEISLIVGVGR